MLRETSNRKICSRVFPSPRLSKWAEPLASTSPPSRATTTLEASSSPAKACSGEGSRWQGLQNQQRRVSSQGCAAGGPCCLDLLCVKAKRWPPVEHHYYQDTVVRSALSRGQRRGTACQHLPLLLSLGVCPWTGH